MFMVPSLTSYSNSGEYDKAYYSPNSNRYASSSEGPYPYDHGEHEEENYDHGEEDGESVNLQPSLVHSHTYSSFGDILLGRITPPLTMQGTTVCLTTITQLILKMEFIFSIINLPLTNRHVFGEPQIDKKISQLVKHDFGLSSIRRLDKILCKSGLTGFIKHDYSVLPDNLYGYFRLTVEFTSYGGMRRDDCEKLKPWINYVLKVMGSQKEPSQNKQIQSSMKELYGICKNLIHTQDEEISIPTYRRITKYPTSLSPRKCIKPRIPARMMTMRLDRPEASSQELSPSLY